MLVNIFQNTLGNFIINKTLKLTLSRQIRSMTLKFKK